MQYNRTNLAYEIEISGEEMRSENTESRISETKKAKKKKSYSGFLLFICSVYIIGSIASLLFKTATVNEKKNELESIKKQYEEVLNENKKIEVELNSEVDLRKVEDIAIARLDMNKPKSSQIVYVNTNPNDYGEVVEPDEDAVKENRGIFGSIIKTFTGIFAYSN